MDIKLYTNLDENIKLDKELLGDLTLHCSIIENTDVLNPVVKVKLASIDPFTIIRVYNYAYIPDLNRYYYITDYKMDVGGITIIYLKVDVLMSYKESILNLSALISRNQYLYNNMLEDTRLFLEYDNNVNEYEAPDPENPDYRFVTLGNAKTAIMVTRETWVQSGTGILYETIPTNNNVLREIPRLQVSPEVTNNSKGVCLLRVLWTLIHNLTSQTQSYVESITLYPFEIELNERDAEPKQIYLNNIEIPYAEGYATKYANSPYLTIADFTIPSANKFTDFEPYSRYELYLPYHQWVTFKACDILNNRLLVIYTVDYLSNSASVNVIDATHDKLLYTAPCMLGMRFGLTTDNQFDIDNQRISNILNTVIGGLGSGLKATGQIASGKTIEGIGSIASGVNNIAQGIIKENSLYTTATATVSSSNEAYMLPQKVRVRITQMKPYEPINYNKYYGKPLKETYDLIDLRGYTEVESVHLEGIRATSSELTEIENLLKTGVILPDDTPEE